MRYYLAILYFLAILPCLYVGSWSDHFGRRKPLCIPFIFSIFASVSLVFASVFVSSDIMAFVFLAAGFSGISGGTMSLTANCFGYISDITSELNRTKRIIVLEAMLFLGGFCGFNLAGLLLSNIGKDLQYAFLVTLALYIVSLIYIFCFLCESREVKTADWRYAIKLDHFRKVMKTVFQKRDSAYKRPKILLLMICGMISVIAIAAQTSILFPFLKNLGWESSLYGYYSGLMNLVNGISLVVILPLACKYLPHFFSDAIIAIFGFCSKAAGLLLLGFSTSTALVFVTPIVFLFNEFTMPPIRSLLSKLVNDDEKGRIFAFLSACQNVAQFFGTLAFTSLFAETVNWFPGTCFEIVALMQIIALLLFL
ncbi:Proton-coupled folate transporter-like protein [Leptotrombidium deliense]|uniref:Proton-coupled folate transporter-like protein n=1 Tax=Leptotrombidium deliense TaxID=299467 RepID=A0A443S8N7_9ACAR|nr:Proton-coupled folate transporter-like protein [Leptotrombidium deliense]